MRKLFLITLVFLFICSCQTHQVKISHMAAAESSVPQDVKSIAVFAYDYDENNLDPRFRFLKEDIPSAVLSAITEYGTYSVIGHDRLKQIMEARMVSAGPILDSKKAMEIAKVAESNALVMGKITLVSLEDRNIPRTVEINANDPDKKNKTKKIPYIVRKVTLSVNSEMIHVKSGQKIVTSNFTKTYDSETDPNLEPGIFQKKDAQYYESLPGKIPSVENILQNLAKECAKEFISKISAHPIEYKISLMRGNTPEFKNGEDWVKQEQYDRAMQEYMKATKDPANSAAAWFNIGVCHESLKRYVDAMSAYEKSNEIKPSSQAKKGISRVEKYGR